MTGPTSVTLDEFDEQQNATKTPNATELKLEAEGLPDDMRGKTADDVAKQVEGLKNALKVSEENRLLLRKQLESTPSPSTTPAAPPPPEQPKEKTREEIAEMFQSDPLAAIEYAQEQSARKLLSHIETRFGSVVSAQAQSAETQAREKYKDEFALFPDDIKKFMDGIPNKQAFQNPAAWDDMIAYIRGVNFDKFMEFKTKPKEKAREAEIENVGFSGTTRSERREIPSGKLTQLDETQKEICRNLNISEEDYIKYYI